MRYGRHVTTFNAIKVGDWYEMRIEEHHVSRSLSSV